MNGYLYCVYTEDGLKNDYFNKELIPSFNSLKKLLPDSSVALYTNVKFNNDEHGFDHVIYDEDIDKRLIAKAHGLLKSPYDRTIFLDTDMIIHRDIINDIFGVLDEFNFAVVYGNCFEKGTVYPDFNTGLIGVKNNSETKKLLEEWIDLFEDTLKACPLSPARRAMGPRVGGNSFGTATGNDQWAFRKVFMKNKTMFHILPPYFMLRWNMMRDYPKFAVLSHDRSMDEDMISKVTIRLIDSYKNQLHKKNIYYW